MLLMNSLPFRLPTSFLLTAIVLVQHSPAVSRPMRVSGSRTPEMSDAVNRAIELTKRRQSADRDADSTTNEGNPLSASKKQKALRIQVLDVEKLNTLIKAVDRAWTLPRRNGRREPIGSNFQYKKTCASIYKARFRACQQPGFGIMCFNFCYEQGEELAFKCEDTSEPVYCRANANFNELLSKYRKDPYKTKAYIHQMMSRCYATSICDGSPLLHTTAIEVSVSTSGGSGRKAVAANNWSSVESGRNAENEEDDLVSPTPSPSKKSGRAGSFGGSSFRRWSRRSNNSSSLTSKSTRPASGSSGRRRAPLSRNSSPPPPTSDRRGVKWIQKHEERTEDGDMSVEELVTPRYVPFWQQLLVRKQTMIIATTTTVPTGTLPRRRSPPKRKVVGKMQKGRRRETTAATPSQHYPSDTTDSIGSLEVGASEEEVVVEEVRHGPYSVIQPKLSVAGGKSSQPTLVSSASKDGPQRKKYRLVTDDSSDYDIDAEDSDVDDNNTNDDEDDDFRKKSANGQWKSLIARNGGNVFQVAEVKRPTKIIELKPRSEDPEAPMSVEDQLEPPKFTGGLVDITTVEVVGANGQRQRIATWTPPGRLSAINLASRNHRAVAANPHRRYAGSMEKVPRRMKESAGAAGLSGNVETNPLAFWNKFQPGRWYHSIHYMTNTG